jgi:hypothetical protein
MTSLQERESVIKACQQIIQLLDSNSAAQVELASTELSSQVVTVDENDLTFFAPPTDVDSSMIDLTEKTQSIIVNLRPQVSELAYNYVLDTLYPFHFHGTFQAIIRRICCFSQSVYGSRRRQCGWCKRVSR